MGLRFDPVGGGQFKQALQTIIEAERQPIKALEGRKAREEARLKLFGEFKTKFSGLDKALSELTSFRKFRELKADLGDGDKCMSVTLDKDVAEPGSYTLQVDQLAERTSLISNGFENPDDIVLGIGFIVANLSNGESAEIFVDEDHASLRGISKLINQETDLPFTASVVKDMATPERPWKLIISSKKDNAEERVVSFPELYFLDGKEDLYIDDEHEAQNALIQIDGFPIEADSNDIKDFLQGVNVHLKQARPDQPFNLTISQDYQKISGKVKSLVEQINGILEFINKQNQIDEKSDTRSTFAGDTGLQNIEYRLRNIVHEGFPADDPKSDDGFRLVFLNKIGVEFEKNGQLTFKEDKFTKSLESDYDAISQAITGEMGLAHQLRTVLTGYTRLGDGLLSTREQALRNRITGIDRDIAQKERRIEQRTQSLTAQFARLQGSLASMQKQQQYLSAALPTGGGGNLVSQLLGG